MTISLYANPGRFLSLARVIVPVLGVFSLIAFVGGIYFAFFASPADYQQGDAVRIMYVHVPSAWMALFVYTSMAISAFVALVWKHVLAELYARAAAPLGALFTLLCLVSGSIWGKPMWGTWWVWDARLTSVLILFFFYVGYVALSKAFDDEQRGTTAGNYLLLVGAINVPIVKFSVDWWNTLHQTASVSKLGGPAIDIAMLLPLGLMAIAFMALFSALVCLRLETEIRRRRQRVRLAGGA